MERNFYNEGFEDLLKQKADQYKIYPSERVWKNIYQSLHSRRKGFTIGGLLLLLLGGFVMMEESLNEHLDKSQAGFIPVMDASRAYENSTQNNPFVFSPSANKSDSKSPSLSFSPTAKVVDLNLRTRKENTLPVFPGEQEITTVNGKIISLSTVNKKAEGYSTISNDDIDPAQKPLSIKPALLNKENAKAESDKKSSDFTAVKIPGKRKNVFGFNIYLSPSVTYRRLSEDKNAKQGANLPVAADHLDVNKFVNHKPALGAEFGGGVFYNVSRNFVLKGGLQLNFMRYTISAFQSAPEKIMIALSSSGRGGPDTLTGYSSIRNIGGSMPEQLQNQYFQVSMPIGAELKLLGDRPFQLNIAGSLQPTYLISHTSYLLSNNLTNYTKEPSLARRWNLYTSIETYISYQRGDVRIQMGPQFRYQLLSSYDSRYPIREYLMEYGIKFGVIKTLK